MREQLRQVLESTAQMREQLERLASFAENNTTSFVRLGSRWIDETPVATYDEWCTTAQFPEISREVQELWQEFDYKLPSPEVKEGKYRCLAIRFLEHLLPASSSLRLWDNSYVASSRACLRPDISLTNNDQSLLRWNCAVLTAEVETNLSGQYVTGTGQAIKYTVEALTEQTKRRIIYTFVTDCRQIEFYRLCTYPKYDVGWPDVPVVDPALMSLEAPPRW